MTKIQCLNEEARTHFKVYRVQNCQSSFRKLILVIICLITLSNSPCVHPLKRVKSLSHLKKI